MKPSAPYRRRCSACGASALKVASRCPACGEAMPTRDARGDLLVLWGCHGCHTLNTPDQASCQHCQAPRGQGVATRRWAGVGVAVAAVAAIMVFAGSRPSAEGEPTPLAVATPPAAAPMITPAATEPTTAAPITSPPSAAPVALVVAPPPPPPIAVTMADQEVRRPTTADAATLPIVEVVSVTWVNVRSAPTPSAAIVGVIKPQTAARRLGERDGWVQLRTDTLVGWVYAQGLTER